jgi:type IVB pilus formation R64 PilN family outer membrane protein
MMKTRYVLCGLAAALLAAGCTSLTKTIEKDVESTQSRIEGVKGEAPPAAPQPAPIVQTEDGVWIAQRAMKISAPEQLPPVFDQFATFDRPVASLAEFMQRMTLRSSLTITATPDALTAALRTLQSEQARAGIGASPVSPVSPVAAPGVPALPAALSAPARAAGAAMAPAGAPAPIRLTYVDGTLKGLLDTAAARFGVSWRYANNTVQFYFTDTRSFQIRAIPGDSSLSATVGNNASADIDNGTNSVNGSNRANQQATAVSSKLSVFDSIEKSIAAMLSPHGKVVASPATGTVSVTDTPDVLARVSKFVDDENETLSRQVMINVTVLAVAASDLDDYGINWNLVYGTLNTKFGVKSTHAAQAGASSFSAAILDTSSSRFAGSSLLLSALSSQGKVRRETSASVATLNNQPVPVQVARQTSFLKSSSTSLTANVGSTTTLEPGTVTSGFNMTILPHVLSNGTVMLQFSTDISALRNIRTVTSGGGNGSVSTSIETPEVDTRNFLQRVAMKSGETLVISGFEQTDSNLDRKGVGDPKMVALGGGVKASTDKEVIIILITPITMGGA